MTDFKQLYEKEKAEHDATKAALQQLREAFRRHFLGLLNIALLLITADEIIDKVIEYSERNVTR